ncbi:MAG: response regulator [Planctomycetes bacterium]|nr:response regulator [Planctomycetota bacterium]
MEPARILLVEDNQVNQKVAAIHLRKLGYQVDVVENGEQALVAHATGAYDVILMDCQMPRMDGYSAARAIRAREGDSSHTPIIALTAFAMEGDRERCLEAGMDEYLSKPIDLAQLRRTVESFLK